MSPIKESVNMFTVCALCAWSVHKICLHFIVSQLWILWNNNCIVIHLSFARIFLLMDFSEWIFRNGSCLPVIRYRKTFVYINGILMKCTLKMSSLFCCSFTFLFKSVVIFDRKERQAKKFEQKNWWQSKIKDTLWTLSLFITFVFLNFFLSLCTFSLFFARSFCSKFVYAHKIKRAIFFIVVCINFTVNACKASSVRSIFPSKLLPLSYWVERFSLCYIISAKIALLTSKWLWRILFFLFVIFKN